MPTSNFSFSQRVKRELAKNKYSAPSKVPLLSALLKQRAEMVLGEGSSALEVRLKSPATLQLVYLLLKELFTPSLQTGAGDSLSEGGYRIYELRITSQVEKIIASLYLNRPVPPKQALATRQARWSYLVGAFLGGGFVSDPSASKPGLEITCSTEAMASLLLELFEERGFVLKKRNRRGLFVCYLKRADRIVDLLKLLNAPEATLAFEDARIARDLSWQLSKLNNIDIANQQKTMNAARELINDIDVIKRRGQLADLPAKMVLFCRLRASRPNASLAGIATEMDKRGMPVSKAGLGHYSRKIRSMVEQAKGQR